MSILLVRGSISRLFLLVRGLFCLVRGAFRGFSSRTRSDFAGFSNHLTVTIHLAFEPNFCPFSSKLLLQHVYVMISLIYQHVSSFLVMRIVSALFGESDNDEKVEKIAFHKQFLIDISPDLWHSAPKSWMIQWIVCSLFCQIDIILLVWYEYINFTDIPLPSDSYHLTHPTSSLDITFLV